MKAKNTGRSRRRKTRNCHRCGDELRWLAGQPYCSGCNWDSLNDPIYDKNLKKKLIDVTKQTLQKECR